MRRTISVLFLSSHTTILLKGSGYFSQVSMPARRMISSLSTELFSGTLLLSVTTYEAFFHPCHEEDLFFVPLREEVEADTGPVLTHGERDRQRVIVVESKESSLFLNRNLVLFMFPGLPYALNLPRRSRKRSPKSSLGRCSLAYERVDLFGFLFTLGCTSFPLQLCRP